MTPHFDWTISIGNVAAVVVVLGTAIAAWYGLNVKVDRLIQWKSDTTHRLHDGSEMLAATKEGLVRTVAIIEGIEKRVSRIEERNDRE